MEDLRERVEAVERALTDGNGELTALAEGAASAERVEELSSEVAALQEEVAELSAATQALRGYVGNVRSVNEAVEERADAAVAAADSLEERVERLESDGRATTHHHDPPEEPPAAEPNSRRQHTRSIEVQGTGGSPQSPTCSACGRPSDGAAAPDGGTNNGFPDGGGPTRPQSTGSSPDPGTPSPSRESLDGFDPNDRGGRVTVSEERADPAQRSGTPGRAGEDGGERTLVDRMRELL